MLFQKYEIKINDVIDWLFFRSDRMATLWMGDVPPMATEDSIMAAFAGHYETPIGVKMGRNLMTTGNGYCFVTFPSADHAEKVLVNLNGKPITNVPGMTRFKLNYAAHKAGNQNRNPFGNVGANGVGGYQPGRNTRTQFSVYVGNLAANISNKALFDLFSTKCPETIVSAHTYLDQHGTKRFGFVNFVDESEIEKALTLDGTEYLSCGDGIAIKVNKTNERNKGYNAHQTPYPGNGAGAGGAGGVPPGVAGGPGAMMAAAAQAQDYTNGASADYNAAVAAAAAYSYDANWYNTAAAAAAAAAANGSYNMYYGNPAWAAAVAGSQQHNPYAAAAAAYQNSPYPAAAAAAAAAGLYGAPQGAVAVPTGPAGGQAGPTAQTMSQVAAVAAAGMAAASVAGGASAGPPPPQVVPPGATVDAATAEHELVATDMHRPQDEYMMNRQAIARDEAAYEYLERNRWVENFGQVLIPLPNVF